MSVEVTPSQGPPRPPGGGAMEPRIRDGPYDSKKQVSFSPDFPWGPQPESMDSAASAPAAIAPMEERSTVPKRHRWWPRLLRACLLRLLVVELRC